MIPQENLGKAEGQDSEEFRRSLEDLGILIKEMKKYKKSGEKEILIKNLQKNIVRDVEKQIKVFKEMKMSSNEYAKALKKFEISEELSYQEFEKYLNIKLPNYRKNATENFAFPDGSRILKKTGTDQWKAISCSQLLPHHFTIKIRINNYTRDTFSYLGLCKDNFQTAQSKSSPWLDNQLAYKSTGNVYFYNKPTISGNKGYDGNGNILSISYDKNKRVMFEVNGEKQPISVDNLEGPFYFWASLYYTNSEIEIIEVTEL